MQNLALLSGLIGALISAGLSYWIRDKLDSRSMRNAEVRLAYVYFVRISEFVAFDVVIRSLVSSFSKTYGGERFDELFSSKSGSFEPSHAASVLIAQELQKLTPEKLKENSSLSIIPIFLKLQMDAISESNLSAEQLSKLPKDVVFVYSLFLKHLSYMRGIILLWTSFFEQQNTSWVTPEAIHEQWIAIAKLFEHARSLRSALLSADAASTSEASVLLKKQISVYNETFFDKLKDKPKLQAALTEVKNKTAADSATNDSATNDSATN